MIAIWEGQSTRGLLSSWRQKGQAYVAYSIHVDGKDRAHVAYSVHVDGKDRAHIAYSIHVELFDILANEFGASFPSII